MACATLKRSQNFDILDSTATKRRKFGSYSRSFTPNNGVPASCSLSSRPSPFVPSEPITQTQLKRRIKEEIKRLQRRRLIPRFLGTPAPQLQMTFIAPNEDTTAIASCSGSLRSMALRSPRSDGQDSDSDQSSPLRLNESTFQNFPAFGTVSALSQPQVAPSQPPLPKSLDTVPIFTLPQVTSLCDRLIKEREDELRQEYDCILSCKLAEQYEAFLKFSHDQLYSRFQSTPMSYVS
ncbi:Transmembrane 9 superfamily protein member 4 [Fasciola hepatica]|uniref:Transmembrane 9 superfamily protein member 4 n=1 Tax=Fasciola hepatica TaxID=6192 RepID=A0A4E0RSS4_FASHE|nr:Transmembrane 9 superfamily protein member 4 [Fasciola hepatica]